MSFVFEESMLSINKTTINLDFMEGMDVFKRRERGLSDDYNVVLKSGFVSPSDKIKAFIGYDAARYGYCAFVAYMMEDIFNLTKMCSSVTLDKELTLYYMRRIFTLMHSGNKYNNEDPKLNLVNSLKVKGKIVNCRNLSKAYVRFIQSFGISSRMIKDFIIYMRDCQFLKFVVNLRDKEIDEISKFSRIDFISNIEILDIETRFKYCIVLINNILQNRSNHNEKHVIKRTRLLTHYMSKSGLTGLDLIGESLKLIWDKYGITNRSLLTLSRQLAKIAKSFMLIRSAIPVCSLVSNLKETHNLTIDLVISQKDMERKIDRNFFKATDPEDNFYKQMSYIIPVKLKEPLQDATSSMDTETRQNIFLHSIFQSLKAIRRNDDNGKLDNEEAIMPIVGNVVRQRLVIGKLAKDIQRRLLNFTVHNFYKSVIRTIKRHNNISRLLYILPAEIHKNSDCCFVYLNPERCW